MGRRFQNSDAHTRKQSECVNNTTGERKNIYLLILGLADPLIVHLKAKMMGFLIGSP